MVGYSFVNLQVWKGMGAIAILLSMLTFFAGQEAAKTDNTLPSKEGLYQRERVISPNNFEARYGLYRVDETSEVDG